MKKLKTLIFIIVILALTPIVLFGSDNPIIFLHGIQTNPKPEAGWPSWNNPRSSMRKILNEGYKEYKWGLTSTGDPANQCDKNTQLQNMPDFKRIYNFSYYHPAGQRGVISLSEDSVLVYIKHVHDIIGRHFIIVVAPFAPNYPPSNYDSTTYYPKYIPSLTYALIDPPGAPSYHAWVLNLESREYIKSWKRGKFAKRLDQFIDKVLNVTGAQKVDIVAHSMGGLVARAAIKEYNCASKVRKLITIGTPNKGCHYPSSIPSWLYDLFNNYQEWQKKGEILELNADSEIDFNDAIFIDLSTGNDGIWCDLLGYSNNGIDIVTISGKRNKFEIAGTVWPLPTSLIGENDGLIASNWVKMSCATFNPTIYASHTYYGQIEEYAELTSTYTTEYIKVWMIDDETLPDIYFTSNSSFDPSVYLAYELNLNFSTNLGSENPWEPILSTSITMWNVLGDTVHSKGYGWHTKGSEFEKCLSPVFCLSPDLFPVNVKYFANIRHQNMVDGDVKVNKPSVVVLDHGGPAAYVHFNIPSSGWTAGDKLEITNIDLGAYGPEDTTYHYRWMEESYQDCDLDWNRRWTVPYRAISEPSDSIILKCEVELDSITYLRCWKKALVYARTAPENLSLSYTGASIKVSWHSMGDNDYYEVWRSEIEKAEPFIMIGTTYSSPYYDEDFPEGDCSFHYKVRGNFTNFSDYKDINFYHLAPPTSFRTQIFQDSIVALYWRDKSNLNIGYEIKRKDMGDGTYKNWAIYQEDAESDRDTVNTSRPGYIYWVRAFDDGWAHTSSWAGPDTVRFDHTPPTVNITSPGQYRVVYEGPFIVKWQASDNSGIFLQTLYYPYNSVGLDGDVRSKEVYLQITGKGLEGAIKLEAMDSAGNTGEDENKVVIIDPSQTNYNLRWTHDNNWNITISSVSLKGKEGPKVVKNPFNRVYKGKGDNWERINLSPRNQWTDPDPLNECQTRNYLVCLNDFDSLSDTLTVHRPAGPHPCPVLYTFNGDSFEQDNSLLPESEFTHQLTRDYYILKKKPEEKDGTYRFKIIEGLDNTYIDLIKLRVIDHPKGLKIGTLPNGEVTPFKPSILPFKAIDKKGKDWKDSLLTEGRGYYYGKKGDYLDAYFREKGDYLYTILAPPKDPVESSSKSKGSMMLYSRMNGSANLLQSPDSVIRFLPKDSLCRIDYVRKAFRLPDILIKEKEASPEGLPLEITKEDSLYYHLSPGDTLKINFKAVDPAPLLSRSYCLEIVGYYLPVGESKGSEEREQREKVYESYIRPSSSIFTGNILLNASSNERKTVKIEVIDRIGRIVKQKDVRLSRGEQMINLGELKSGIYFIKVSAERGDIHKITVIR